MAKRILVTGGAGFLGSHLVDDLLDRGDTVVVVDNCVTGSWSNLAAHGAHPRLMRVEADATARMPVEGHFDLIFHLASPASPKDFLPLALEVMAVNSIGTQNCLDLAHESACPILFASTSEVYGDPLVHPQPETYWGNVNPNGARSVYDESKRFGEALMFAYKRTKGVRIRVARIFNSYGPRMRPDDGRVTSTLILQALKNEPMTIYGDGSQTRSFAYCKDTVRGLLKLAESQVDEPVNIGSDAEISVRGFAELVRDLTKSNSEIIEQTLPEDDPKVRRPDLTRAKSRLGFEPEVTLENGLYATIEHFRRLLNPSPV